MAKKVVKKTASKKVVKPTTKKAPTKKKTSTVTKKTTNKKPKEVVSKKVIKKPTTRKRNLNKSAPPKDASLVKSEVKTMNKYSKRSHNPADYVKVSERSKPSKFKDMGDKVQRGEVKWVYYSTENDIGYHFYLKIK
tara:strand:+ start:6894 stop:7301 length:408 start_codon:yes stop_codon:yes gene_type:complete